MKKEEIKYDPVRDNFLKTITYISNNPNNFLKVSGLILVILLVFIIYSNNSNKQKLADNRFISIATNKHLDNKIDLSIPNFKEVLVSFKPSESYNQAYIYLFNYYLENNFIDSLDLMIENSKFDSNDKNIESSLNMIYGDYYQRKGDVDKAISSYKKAIKSFTIKDRIIYTKIKLCMLYKDLSMSDDFTNLFNTIDYDSISDFQLKSLYEQISIKN
tara:strand:- start:35807 stop:36454 length:648 start_codon:yes stop_codon:yes gene_type:complete